MSAKSPGWRLHRDGREPDEGDAVRGRGQAAEEDGVVAQLQVLEDAGQAHLVEDGDEQVGHDDEAGGGAQQQGHRREEAAAGDLAGGG